MWICKYCETENRDESIKCVCCGMERNSHPSQQYPEGQSQSAPERRKNSLIGVVLGIIAAVLAGFFLVIWSPWKSLPADDKSAESETQPAPTVQVSTPEPVQLIEDKWDWSLEGDVLTIAGTGNVSCPDDEWPWKDEAKHIVHVVIEDGITGVFGYAFSFNDHLISISIPASLNSIDQTSYYSCTRLTEFTVSPNNQSYCSYGGVLYDKAMSELVAYPPAKDGTIYEIPPSVKRLEDYAFYSCTKLKSIEIPFGVTSIGERSFLSCTGLSSIYIPPTVSFIGVAAFDQTNMKEILVAEENQHYCSRDGVLYTKDMKTLICYPSKKTDKEYVIPFGVTKIAIFAFRGSQLASVEIPSTVQIIEEGAFFGNGMLKSAVIPSGVQAIEHLTFFSCSKLKSIFIPASIKSIAKQAFDYCNSLSTVNYESDESQWKSIFIDELNDKIQTAVIVYNYSY